MIYIIIVPLLVAIYSLGPTDECTNLYNNDDSANVCLEYNGCIHKYEECNESFEIKFTEKSSQLLIKREIAFEDAFFGDLATARITIDTERNYIIGDGSSNQLRKYDSDGVFINAIGRAGRGPGEYNMPTDILTISDSRYVVSDLMGRIQIFDYSGANLSSYLFPPIVMNLSYMKGDKILGNISAIDKTNTLALMDIGNGKIIKSFFEKPYEEVEYGGVLSMVPGEIIAESCGEYIYAFVAFTGSMFVFNDEGEMVNEYKDLNLPKFEPLQKLADGEVVEQNKIAEVMESFSLIDRIFCTVRNTLLLQYFQYTGFVGIEEAQRGEIHDYQLTLVELNTSGEVMNSFHEKNRLVGYDSHKDQLILYDVEYNESLNDVYIVIQKAAFEQH